MNCPYKIEIPRHKFNIRLYMYFKNYTLYYHKNQGVFENFKIFYNQGRIAKVGLIVAYPGEKQKVVELSNEEIVPALISLLESI